MRSKYPVPQPSQNPDPFGPRLPRLPAENYRGRVSVHWIFAEAGRGTGWLNESFANGFRWILLHGSARFSVACPLYCLMPDHVHLLLHGWEKTADQLLFVRFVRLHTARLLAQTGHRWQSWAYDHVLREEECEKDGFVRIADYIRDNPVRAGLVSEARNWPWSGAVVPGYPELVLWQEDYWDRWWRLENVRHVAEFARTRNFGVWLPLEPCTMLLASMATSLSGLAWTVGQSVAEFARTRNFGVWLPLEPCTMLLASMATSLSGLGMLWPSSPERGISACGSRLNLAPCSWRAWPHP
jgi:putative transposase